VYDQSGAPVPDALVVILPLPKTLGNDLSTDRNGKLSLDVPSGSYKLTVIKPGFRVGRKHIEAQSGTHPAISIVLNLRTLSNLPVVAATPLVSSSEIRSFPEQTHAISPDGRYWIVDVKSNSEPHHTVFLEDCVRDTKRFLFNYDRRVVLMWTPNSQWFTATIEIGPDSTRSSIYSVDENIPPINVLDLLLSQLAESEQIRLKSMLSNQRVRMGVGDWDGAMQIEVSIHAYGATNPDGSGANYTVQLPPRKP